jgi:serine palmitoyltransferase
MARIHKLAAWSVVIVTAALLIAWPSPASANSVDVWGEVQSEIRLLFSGARRFWDVVGPGGKLHPAYFLEHKGHLVVEGLLILIIGYLFLQHSFKPHPKSEEPLTEKVRFGFC